MRHLLALLLALSSVPAAAQQVERAQRDVAKITDRRRDEVEAGRRRAPFRRRRFRWELARSTSSGGLATLGPNRATHAAAAGGYACCARFFRSLLGPRRVDRKSTRLTSSH